MRKITLMFICLFGTLAYGQVNINENFNSGFPAGWTQTGNLFDDVSATGACEGSSYRDNLWGSSTTGTLTTPNQAAASNGTDLAIQFDYKVVEFSPISDPTQPGWGSIELQYSTDGGSNWTTTLTINDGNHTTSADCATMMTTISSGDLPNASDVQLQFVFTYVTGDYYVYIDNFTAQQVSVSPPDCDATLTETTDVSVAGDISWSQATGVPTSYDLTVGTTMGGSDVLATTDVGNITSFNLGTLMFSTTYYVTIVPKNDNGSATGCTEQTFVTKAAPTLPTVDTVFTINTCGESATYNTAYDVAVQPFVWVQINVAGACPSLTVDTEGGDFDTEIGLYDSNGLLIGNDDDGGTGTLSSFTANDLPAGTYYAIAGTFNTVFGADDFDVSTTNTTRTGTIFLNASTQSNATADYFNLQFPASGNITAGSEFLVFAQIYEAGLTDASSDPAAGIESWIGYSTTDSSPDTDADWTWVAATTNPGFDFSQNNDEYFLDLGAELTTDGTYYYASRWRLSNGPFTYGGILPDGSNGGEWGTNGFASGVLTVIPAPAPNCVELPITPEDGATGVSGFNLITVSWTAPSTGPTPTSYDVYFGFESDGSDLFLFDTTSDTSITATVGAYDTDVYWTVIPKNADTEAVGCDTTLFSFTTESAPPPSTNTSCATAELISCGETAVGNSESTSGTAEDIGCSMGVNGLWYSFIGTGLDVTLTSTATFDHRMGIAAGTCGSLVNEVCRDLSFGAETYEFSTVAGETYYVYIAHYDNGNTSTGTITLNLECAIPANDECTGAEAITLGEEVNGDNTGATDSNINDGCIQGNVSDVWYSFVATATGEVSINITPGFQYGVYSDCAGTLVGTCNTTPISGLTESTTYYLRVSDDGTNTLRAPGAFALTVSESSLSNPEFNSSTFSYYPNPTKGKVQFESVNPIERITALNMLGQTVLDFQPNAVSPEFDMSSLQAGTYFLRVSTGNVTETIRVIKQ